MLTLQGNLAQEESRFQEIRVRVNHSMLLGFAVELHIPANAIYQFTFFESMRTSCTLESVSRSAKNENALG